MSIIAELYAKFRVWGMPGVCDYVARSLHWRKMARELRRLSRCPGDLAQDRGITLIGDFFSAYSNSKTNRDFAFALKDAGIPFQIFATDRVSMVPDSDIASLVTPRSEFRLDRYSHVVEMFRSPLPAGLVPRRARIAFWEGEHGILSVWPFLGGNDPVIGMSDFNVRYFRREFKAPVYKILYPLRHIDVEFLPKDVMRGRFGIRKDDFMVFFNFDFGSYKRKNPIAALRAFAEAFPVERNAKLVFKTLSASKHSNEVEEVMSQARTLGIGDRFVMITEYLPHAELYGLTNSCDVYISLHRGEGFGLGMAEAMLMGKPVVATDWSANTEYCLPGSSFPVAYRLVPVKPDEYFADMQEWAEADTSDAARHLRRCYDDRAFAEEVGAKGKAFVEEHFSLKNFKASVEAFLDGKEESR